MSYHKSNNLILGTKYEDTSQVSYVSNAEWEASVGFKDFFQESLQNYKRIAGYIYSVADLAKLTREQRPKFVSNYLLPIILQLMGNFINNQSKVEAIPRTPGDVGMANIITDLLDYAHYTANDLQSELNKAYANALIGRVGWIVHDYSYTKDTEGMVDINSYDPFRLMWDNTYTKKDLSKTKWIIDRGWYSPEEIRNIYASDDNDMYDEITEKAKMYLGTDPLKQDRLISFVERVWGASFNYRGKDQGYDEVTRLIDSALYNNQEFYDAQRGLFKVTEFHERRSDKIKVLFDADKNQWYDISKAIDLSSDGKKYDNDKLQAIRQEYQYPIIGEKIVNQIYVTAVCPAFNMKLLEAAQPVQNGNFKYTQISCFDFGMDSLDWKSYIDHIIDPTMSIILSENTMQTYMLKATHGETWFEENALGEYEDEMLSNSINGIKTVKDGTITRKRFYKPPLPTLPLDLVQNIEMKKQAIKEISGVQGNSMGMAQTGRENARLFQQRVAQADLMQSHVQDNAIGQLTLIGENTKDYLQKHLTVDRVIRITNDETDPYWLQINKDNITKLFSDEQGNITDQKQIQGNIQSGKYDIILSKAPFGEAAKQKDFQELMMVNEFLMKLNPAYVDAAEIVKSSRLRAKDKMLLKIEDVNKQEAQKQQQQAQQSQVENALNMQNAKENLASKHINNRQKAGNLENKQALESTIAQGIS